MDALVHRGKCPPTWKEDILQMGREGKALVHIVNYLNVTFETFYRLKERDPEFLGTVNRMKELSEEWWIDIARREWLNGNSKTINSNHWSLMMRNMFNDRWKDRKDYDVKTDGKPITQTNKIEVEILGLEQDKEDASES
jgi:hypothetical protein